MLISTLLVVLAMVAFPATPPGRALRALLVERPARFLDALTPGRIAFYGGLGLVGLGLFWLFETEGVRLFMFMAPDLLVWFTVFDVSVFMDVFILGVTLAATARVRGLVPAIIGRARRIAASVVKRASGRERKTRSRTTRSGDGSDGADPASWGLATA